MNQETQSENSSVWHQHFWPWFIVVLLGVSVLASLFTVSIAFRLGPMEMPEDEALRTHPTHTIDRED